MSLQARTDALALAVGHAITRWANLELALLKTFATATSMPISTAAALFRHIKTFSLSLDLVNTAVNCRLGDPPEMVHWRALVEYIRELSGDRNLLAHNPMVRHGPGHPETTPAELVEVRIGPSGVSMLTREPSRSLDVAEIKELVLDFQQAIELVMDFEKVLATGATSHERYRSPISRRRPPRKQRLEGGPPAGTGQP